MSKRTLEINESESYCGVAKQQCVEQDTSSNPLVSIDNSLEDDIYYLRKTQYLRTLPLEYWPRSEACKEAKWDHMDELDSNPATREEHILATTLKDHETIIEPNMFPYDTPYGIEHWTLWSKRKGEWSHEEIEEFVYEWILKNKKNVVEWNYDDNDETSIDIFHIHVYFSTKIASPQSVKNFKNA